MINIVRRLICKGLLLLPKLYKEKVMQDTRFTSRKYKITLLIILAAITMCLLPPVISMFVFKAATPLVVLSGSEFVSVLSIVAAAYYTSNVFQKKITSDVSTKTQPLEQSTETPNQSSEVK